ncbi:unnamed protein product [marine sediment metagenome]|uniref:Uncharacterized protein n=1 Tax=marine sediment metagenome TaxID=412755 RepID=X0WTX1_9ZZZZ
MKKRKPRKVKVIVTFIDDPNCLGYSTYYTNKDIKHRVKEILLDGAIKNLKIQIIKQTKPKGMVFGEESFDL